MASESVELTELTGSGWWPKGTCCLWVKTRGVRPCRPTAGITHVLAAEKLASKADVWKDSPMGDVHDAAVGARSVWEAALLKVSEPGGRCTPMSHVGLAQPSCPACPRASHIPVPQASPQARPAQSTTPPSLPVLTLFGLQPGGVPNHPKNPRPVSSISPFTTLMGSRGPAQTPEV